MFSSGLLTLVSSGFSTLCRRFLANFGCSHKNSSLRGRVSAPGWGGICAGPSGAFPALFSCRVLRRVQLISRVQIIQSVRKRSQQSLVLSPKKARLPKNQEQVIPRFLHYVGQNDVPSVQAGPAGGGLSVASGASSVRFATDGGVGAILVYA